MPPASPLRQPEPFAPRITLNLRDDYLPPGLMDVEVDDEDGVMYTNNEDEDEFYLREDAM